MKIVLSEADRAWARKRREMQDGLQAMYDLYRKDHPVVGATLPPPVPFASGRNAERGSFHWRQSQKNLKVPEE